MKPSIFIVLIAAGLLVGCGPLQKQERSDLLKKLIGEQCVVQFDRASLGTTSDLPVPPTTDSYNGARTSIHGTLKKYDAEWIVLKTGKTYTYIPLRHVLLIQQI